jgi:hypothetical protein
LVPERAVAPGLAAPELAPQRVPRDGMAPRVDESAPVAERSAMAEEPGSESEPGKQRGQAPERRVRRALCLFP